MGSHILAPQSGIGYDKLLPDYPITKRYLQKLVREKVRAAQKRSMGLFSDIPETKLHEGSRCLLIRNDGSESTIEMERVEASAELAHDIRNLETLEYKDLVAVMDQLGEELGQQQSKLIFQQIDEAATLAGNVGDSSKPFKEQFFDMIQRMDMDFRSDGSPVEQVLVVGSEEGKLKMQKQLDELFSDSESRNRFESIMHQKKREWDDREAARNLVD